MLSIYKIWLCHYDDLSPFFGIWFAGVYVVLRVCSVIGGCLVFVDEYLHCLPRFLINLPVR